MKPTNGRQLMKKLLACLVFLAGLMFLVPSHIAEASNWVWVTSTDYATVTVDSSSVHRYQGTIYYWDRWEFIDSNFAGAEHP